MHHLPQVEELFAAKADSKIFPRWNYPMCYLQLPLDKKSQEYVTINTHRGPSCYTRLLFGVSLVPPIFQSTMETLLRDLAMVIVYIDVFLVAGRSQENILPGLHLGKTQRGKIRFYESKATV